MKDILTKEQREEVERIRANRRYKFEREADDLLAIIDSLQPKQYTEEELRAAWSGNGDSGTFPGWMECARFLGALKEDK